MQLLMYLNTVKRKSSELQLEPAQEKEWTKEKTEVNGDFSPVMKELNKLNSLGFELVNMSTTYTTQDAGQFITTGTPRFTFMMVKKLK